jgi:hypothetical protein
VVPKVAQSQYQPPAASKAYANRALEDIQASAVKRDSDRDVVASWSWIADGQRSAEAVVWLGAAGNPGGVLGEGLRAEPDDRAVEDTHRARIDRGPDVLQRRTGRKISRAVVVEVLDRHRSAEPVAAFRVAGLTVLILKRGEQSGGPTEEHVHRANIANGGRGRLEILKRDADGEVGEAVVVEVPRRQRGAKQVARLRAGEATLGVDLRAAGGQPPAEPGISLTAPASSAVAA